MIALRNLYRNRVRSLLTLFGAAVGIAVFVVLSSISLMVKTSLTSALSAYEGDIIVKTRRAAMPDASRIPQENLASLQAIEGVESVTPLVIGSVKTPWSPFFVILGIPENFTSRLSITRGRAFREGTEELLLGELSQRTIDIELGEPIILADREFIPVGTYVSGTPYINGAAIGSVTAVQEILDMQGFVNIAILHVRDKNHIRDVEKAVRRILPQLQAIHSSNLIDQIQLFQTLNVFLGTISLVALLASCLVVTNTLFMAVWMRTREIGILMAIGWSKARIFRSLLTESLLICILSGLLGNALAILFLKSQLGTGSMGLGWMPGIIAPTVFWTSIGICGVLGLVSGLYPAIVASTLSPAQALRHE